MPETPIASIVNIVRAVWNSDSSDRTFRAVCNAISENNAKQVINLLLASDKPNDQTLASFIRMNRRA